MNAKYAAAKVGMKTWNVAAKHSVTASVVGIRSLFRWNVSVRRRLKMMRDTSSYRIMRYVSNQPKEDWNGNAEGIPGPLRATGTNLRVSFNSAALEFLRSRTSKVRL